MLMLLQKNKICEKHIELVKITLDQNYDTQSVHKQYVCELKGSYVPP